MIGGDIANAAHVGSEVIHFIDCAPRGQQTVVRFSQVEKLELVGGTDLVLRRLNVRTPHPMAIRLQPFDQVVADKAASTRN